MNRTDREETERVCLPAVNRAWVDASHSWPAVPAAALATACARLLGGASPRGAVETVQSGLLCALASGDGGGAERCLAVLTSAAIEPSGAAVHEALSADLTGAVFARLFASARSPQRLVRVEAHKDVAACRALASPTVGVGRRARV